MLAGAALACVCGSAPLSATAVGGDSLRFPVFPVANRSLRDVVSHIGDARDGGRRAHRGIDIAAPRGTPVLAVEEAEVERVDRTPLGGLVVWLRELRSTRRHYFAHLDAVVVRRGQRVAAGAQIGTVGTTGNAAHTQPHLHYQVFDDGRLMDPEPFLGGRPRGRVAARRVPTTGAGQTRIAGAALKTAVSGGRTLAVLRAHERVQIVATEGRYYRVRYGGREGYLARWLVDRV